MAWTHPPADAWIVALGRIVYLFGFAELVTYDCIDALAPEADKQLLRDRAFGERCRIARSLVEAACRRSGAPGAVVGAWASFFDKAPELARRRNVIHNPLLVELYDEPGRERPRAEIGLRPRRKPGPIVLLADVEQLAVDLAMFLEEICRLDFSFGAARHGGR